MDSAGTLLSEQPRMLSDLVRLFIEDLGYTPEELREAMAANEHSFRSQYLGDHSLRAL